MFFSFPHLLSYLNLDAKQTLSSRLDQFCLQARQLKKRIGLISKQALAQLAIGFQRGWNYLSRRSPAFKELSQSPEKRIIAYPESQNNTSSSLLLLPEDLLQNIMDRSDKSSISQSSQSCKSLNETINKRRLARYSSFLPSNLDLRFPNLISISLLIDAKVPLANFKVLLKFSNLLNLDLSKVDLINDDVLAILKDLRTLKSLNLANCRNITDVGLRKLIPSTLARSLRCLNLAQCSQITDLGIEHLGRGALDQLNLQHCSQIRGWGLKAFIHRVPNALECLNLNFHQHLSPKSSKGAHRCPPHRFLDILSLKKLSLSSSDADGKVIKCMAAKLTNLTHLDISSCQDITSKELIPITSLTNLSSLNLADCRVYDDLVWHLTKLKNLQELDLSGCEIITTKSAHVLSKLPKLAELSLNGCSNSLIGKVSSLLKAQKRTETTKVHFLVTPTSVPSSPSSSDTDSKSKWS